MTAIRQGAGWGVLALLIFDCGSLPAATFYSPAVVAAHTAELERSPYVMPTASGDRDLIVGYSHGWAASGIPVHPLYGYKVTNPISQQPKQKIVMMSGNHNAESHGSWALQGALDFWVSEDPQARLLRSFTELYVYPLVNPDGRYTGTGRSNPEMEAQGVSDHNRAWNLSGFSTIDTLTAAMRTDTGGYVDYFFDVHSIAFANVFNTVEELATSDFAAAIAARDPSIVPNVSAGDAGMSRIWAMGEAGLRATNSFTPELVTHFADSQYLDIGRTYALALSDVAVPGPSELPAYGDYFLDGLVNLMDHVEWRDALGETGANLPADGDLSETIDQADYSLWKAHFGEPTHAPAVGTAVPEPMACLLALLAVGLAPACRIRRKSQGR